MSAIVTADIHINQHARDEYRWGLLESFLREQDADELLILGDLTDAKDRHDARLVNRMHAAIDRLSLRYERVIILKGNHDYFDVDHAFFEFLGNGKSVRFASEVIEIPLSIGDALFVPAGTDWRKLFISDVPYLFTHATFMGAKSENGTSMTGVDSAYLRDFGGRCIAGDIHVPQRLARGKIEYTGAPYHTRFGDSFSPRILRIEDDGEQSDLHFPAPRRTVLDITSPDDVVDTVQWLGVRAGDYVKVRCHLSRAEYDKWRSYREKIRVLVEGMGAVWCGSEPVAVREGSSAPREVEQAAQDDEVLVFDYARRKRASAEYLKMGRELFAGDTV